jgi:hypothetical protein
MNTVASAPMYGWDSINWNQIRRSVFKLQKRIYQATLPCRKQRDAELAQPAGTIDNCQQIEEPYEGKLSRAVLKPSGGGDPAA